MTEDIKKPQTGIMTDYEGNPSSMRWMSVGCVFIAVAFGCWTLLPGQGGPRPEPRVAALAPKTSQKLAEKMIGKSG